MRCYLALLLLIALAEYANCQGSSSGGRSSSSSSSRSSVSSRSSSGYSYYSYSSSYYSYSSSYYSYSSSYYGYYGYRSYYSGPASPAGAIAGAVIGGTVLLIVIVFLVVRCCKGRHGGCDATDICCLCTGLCACLAMVVGCGICCRRRKTMQTEYNETNVTRANAPVITTPMGNAAADPDGPSFGGGKWGMDPSANPERLRYVQGNPAENCAGFSAVFPSGRWSGYYVEWAKQNNMQMELRFFDGQVSGQGQDPIGNFMFFGVYRDSTKRVAWVKQYVGKHCVEYRGVGSPSGIDGDWSLLDNPQGSFVSSDAFHLQCDQRIPLDQPTGAPLPPPPPPPGLPPGPPPYSESLHDAPVPLGPPPPFGGPPPGPPPGY